MSQSSSPPPSRRAVLTWLGVVACVAAGGLVATVRLHAVSSIYLLANLLEGVAYAELVFYSVRRQRAWIAGLSISLFVPVHNLVGSVIFRRQVSELGWAVFMAGMSSFVLGTLPGLYRSLQYRRSRAEEQAGLSRNAG